MDFSLRQAAGAFYGPSALEVYTAEASLATAERKLAAVKALARDDEAELRQGADALERGDVGVSGGVGTLSEHGRESRRSQVAVALEQAKRAYEDTEREVVRGCARARRGREG